MKNNKIAYQLFLLLFGLTLVFSGCKKQIDYGSIDIYIDRALFGNTVEFSYNGESLSYYNYDDIYIFTANVNEENAAIDYTFDYNGQHFSSITGEAVTTGSPVYLTAPEDGDIVSHSLSYELRPIGNVDEPFLIFDLNEEDNGVTGNWIRSDGASYLKFSGSSIYLCNGTSLQEFSGTYDASANKATLVEGSTILTFYIYPEGSDKILIEQYVSNEHIGSQYYYKSTEYPCD